MGDWCDIGARDIVEGGEIKLEELGRWLRESKRAFDIRGINA